MRTAECRQHCVLCLHVPEALPFHDACMGHAKFLAHAQLPHLPAGIAVELAASSMLTGSARVPMHPLPVSCWVGRATIAHGDLTRQGSAKPTCGLAALNG